MLKLADLLRELKRLGVGPDEVNLPFSWYRHLVSLAEELANAEEIEADDDY